MSMSSGGYGEEPEKEVPMVEKTHQNPMRARFRDQVREQVKDAALEQLAEGGASAISLNAIARSLEVSGPALYRYFSSRDELLRSLIVDAYTDLRDALARSDAFSLTGRVERAAALTHAYRAWALAQPNRYDLLFKAPLPGYDAHAEPLAEAARSLMQILLAALAPPDGPVTDELSADAVLEARKKQAPDFQGAVRVWSRVHGFVSLELGGAFTAMGIDVDALFEREASALLAD